MSTLQLSVTNGVAVFGNATLPVLPDMVPEYEPILQPGLIGARGWVMLRSGQFLPSVERQFAQRKLDALVRRIEARATKKSRRATTT